jgi:hypothetical protein
MNQFSSLRRAILTLTCLISIHSFAQQAPAEKKSAQIKRVATSENPLNRSLSKNLFKSEDYQAPYTVSVPYQDTETYTVEVPYQVDETYVVQVPYQDTETYTENVPYTVSVPYTDYETDYRQEYRCEPVTRYRQNCHTQHDCYLVPGNGDGQQCHDVQECGVNAQGQQICKTRQVCDGGGGSGPQQHCEDKQVCTNEPYTDQNCGYVNVPYQKAVTHNRNETQYRQETRTRTVTHYRNETRSRTVTQTRTETRTREVTKYRNQEKCCVTKTRLVFDRQLQYNVVVVFPQEAQLAANETETLNVNLISADAQSAQVSIQVVDSVYGYKIANQSVTGASIQVELALAPQFDLINAGASSIQNLKIDFNSTAQKFQVSFVDSLKSVHVQSAYSVLVTDLASGALIEELQVNALANGTLGALMNTPLDSQAKIKATLKVKRSGVQIAGSEIYFESTVNFEKRSLQKEDLAGLALSKNVTASLLGQGLDSALVITDLTPEFSDVASEYTIYLDLWTGKTSKPLNMKVVTRESLKALGSIKLADIIQSPAAIQLALQKGQKVSFDLIAKRIGSSNLLAGKAVKASASGSFIIQ